MIVLICLLLLIAVAFQYRPATLSNVETILTSVLCFSVVITVLTEVLSLFHAINLITIGLCWSLFAITLVAILWRNRVKTLTSFTAAKNKIRDNLRFSTTFEKAVLFSIFSCFLAISIQALIYPPNNWDSMTYHLTRIIYWIGNGSVEHFQTNIIRNLYQPPFSEYMLMHVNLMNGNDYLANLLQVLFLAFACCAIYGILSIGKFTRAEKLVTILIAVTIPSVELQATTTKNDIICAFFILSTVFFAVRTLKDTSSLNFTFLGLSVGFAIFTKGTAYLFLLPILLFFAIYLIYGLIKIRQLAKIKFGFIAVAVVVAINGAHYSRNYKINGSILSIDEVESKEFTNEEINPVIIFSGLLKNAGLHLGYPINGLSDNIIRKIHSDILKIDIDSKSTNYFGIPYEAPKEFATNEDYVPNTLHFLLTLLSLIIISVQGFRNFRKYKVPILLTAILVFQFVSFSGILKWQPWHTRLHIPIFLFSCVAIAYSMKITRWFKLLIFGLTPILLLSFCFHYFYNDLRPIIENPKYTKNISLNDDRFKKYFANRPQLYPEYYKIQQQISQCSSCDAIGLSLSDWEYPLLKGLYYDHVVVQSIFVGNNSRKVPQKTDRVDIIITDASPQNYIELNDRKFYNQTPNHQFIWLYR